MNWDEIESMPVEKPRENGREDHRVASETYDPHLDRDEKIRLLVRSLLIVLGQDPDQSGLKGTPDRIARMYTELLSGYETNVETLVNGALFDVDYGEMVVVKDIEYYSLCEHHLLPFFGRAHVAYIPGKQVIGLSKIARIVQMYARRLQLQERLTQQVAAQLQEVLQPQGVAVVMEGTHLCMAMRGAKQHDARMRTSAMLGRFHDELALRAELLQQLGPAPM
ncbi:MAG: GTP cyclohydrolase I FolE [Anaerolineae bacterium]|nr:GTP cyclohydrolase I FolE [Anaerolineae bacterium]